MKKLVTSALPYVNNIPHLGNLIQMLSADVFARFCRSRGYETLYVCGTDEYGTATETKAKEEGKTPAALCDFYFSEHKKIYDFFNIKFDIFGRTSNAECAEITQALYKDLDGAGLVKEKASQQLFCKKCQTFLADRYVFGTCPKCKSEKARGDQCESCGHLLDPSELESPKCAICGERPEVRETKHLYLDLPAISGRLSEWVAEASEKGRWSENAVNVTKAWISGGLSERAITRDLKWGIPVPRPGYEKKVFYVWFNAPIGYISITKQLANELASAGKSSFDWRKWWRPSACGEKSPGEKSEVQLFQFIGKDNIPFHTVIFPCTLLGSELNLSGENWAEKPRASAEGVLPWTKLFHMSSTEYLNYEDGKFSKSRGVGVFGSDALETGIPADAWRFYIFYNRPEKQDFQFTWKDFQEKLNAELVGNLGNFVNRTLLFVNKYYEGKIPQGEIDSELWKKIKSLEEKITEDLEWANLKDAFRAIFEISDLCNKTFQAAEPWKVRTQNPSAAASLIFNLCYVIKDLAILLHPFLPGYAEKIASYFGKKIFERNFLDEENSFGEGEFLEWKNLSSTEGLFEIGKTEIYFRPMDKKTMEDFKSKFSGTQSERNSDAKNSEGKNSKSNSKNPSQKNEPLSPEEQAQFFSKNIRLVAAKITKVERNPESEKLYVETLDCGSGEPRTIQSGLVPYLKEEELLGKTIILAENLAPRKMRGIESRGMLLAADYKKADGTDGVEVLDVSWAAPGAEAVLEGDDAAEKKPAQISADDFFKVEIKVVDGRVQIGGKNLVCLGRAVTTSLAKNGDVH